MNQRDLRIRIDSQFEDKGFKSAEASARAMVRELDRQERAVRDLANLQMQAQRENEARQAAQLAGLRSLGRGFTAFGLVAAAGMGLAAKSAMDWETAWAGVTKTVNGSADEMARLEEQLRGLARVLPATHEEIAGVAEAAGQLGIQRQDIAAFTKTMIDLGVSTNLSAEDAATGIAQISNVMGTLNREGTAGVSKFGATLVALGNAGASTEADILDMAKRLAGAGKLVGASESDVLALANAMASMGIDAELGGGAIQRVFTNIYAATRDGGDALTGFARIAGMTAQQFATQWAADPVRTFDAFIQGLDRIDKSGGNAVQTLSDVGIEGTQNLQVLLRLKGAGDLLAQSIDLGNKSWDENLALLQEANKRYETAASRIAIARNNLNDAAIDIGGTVLPAIAGVAERIGFLSEAFRRLPDPVKSSVGALGGSAAALSTLGGAALLAIPKLKEMNDTLASLGPNGARFSKGLGSVGSALMGPWGIALAGATVALGLWAESQYEAKKRVDDLRQTLDEQTGAVTDNSQAWARSILFESGALSDAKALGLNLQMVTDAALGNTDAMATLDEQMTGVLERQRDLVNSGQANAGTFDDTMASVTRLGQVLGTSNGDLAKAREEQQLLAEAAGDTVDPMNSAADATGDLAGGMDDTEAAAQGAREEIDKLTAAVEDYGETVLEARDANREYQGAIDDAADSIKQTRDDLIAAAEARGKDHDTAVAWADAQIEAGKALDIGTEAGRRNQEALDGIATSALGAATANFQNGDSVAEVTDKVLAAREEFVKMAVRMGMSSEKANALADDLGLTRTNVDKLSTAIESVPTSHNTKITASTEAAMAALAAYERALTSIPRTIRTNFGQRLPSGGYDTSGGITFAYGGYTGDGGQFDVAGAVHKGEFVSDAETTDKWRGLLEYMHSGGDPRAYFANPVAPVVNSGATSFSESYDQRVIVQALYASDVRDIRRRADRERAYESDRSAS